MEQPHLPSELDGQLVRDLFSSYDIYLVGDFSEIRVDSVVKQLTALEGNARRQMADPAAYELESAEWEDFRVRLHISSYGGSVYEFLRLYDCIQSMPFPVDTIAEGKAMSAGGFLLLSGSGTRSCHINTHIMLHTIQTWAMGDLNDIETDLAETKKLERKLKTIVQKHTGLSKTEVDDLFVGDNYLTPAQAKSMGIIDQVLRPTPENKRTNWR